MYMTEIFSMRKDLEATHLATSQDTVWGLVRELSY